MNTPSFLKKSFYSALIFFGTVTALTIGYSNYISSLPASVGSGSGLTAGEWNKMVSALGVLDTNLSNLTFSGGNVGIGMTVPTTKLVVDETTAGDSRTIGTFQTTSAGRTPRLDFKSSGVESGTQAMILQTGSPLAAYPGLSLQPNGGKVGIGTTSPSQILQIEGSTVAGGNNYIFLRHKDQGVGQGIFIGQSTGSNDLTIDQYANNSIRFKTWGGGSVERMIIDNVGNVGIGTPNPWAALTITKNSNGWDNGVQLLDQNGINQWILHSDTNGNFMIGRPALVAFQINSVGNATLAGVLTQNSDIRLKKNITTLENSLEKISKLNGVTYYWKDSTRDIKRQIGVIAQEVEQVLPELVNMDDKGVKSVNYAGIVAPLIEAVKELSHKIDTLFMKYIDQQKEIDSLKTRLDTLEQQ